MVFIRQMDLAKVASHDLRMELRSHNNSCSCVGGDSKPGLCLKMVSGVGCPECPP